MTFLRWLVRLFVSDARALPAHRPQCACPTDDEGLMRCEGLADVDCRGGCCLIHCRKLCGDRCKSAAPREPVRVAQRCSSTVEDIYEEALRCPAIEDARCLGGNCTMHCKQHCGGSCLKRLRAV